MSKSLFVKKRRYLFLYALLLALFYFKGSISLDPDFGWRIKAGEYYWNYGIPKTDIFSYTMPNFPWVDHAWGTTLIFYLVNEFLGYPVLVFLMAFLVLASILILSKSISRFDFSNSVYKKLVILVHLRLFPKFFLKLDLKSIFPFSFFPLILVTSILLVFLGVRAQVISWFMFSVLVYWISDEKIFKKIKFFLPVFFLVWANLHGSFALGIITLFLYLTFKFMNTRKIISTDNLIGMFSFIVAFVNPYGGGIWREAWSSASDAKLRWSIAEWMPALTTFDIAMVFLICLSLVLIWKYRRSYNLFELIFYLFLLVQAMTSRRQLPLWAIFTFPLIVRGIFYFWNDLKKIKNGNVRFIKVYKIAWIISVFIILLQVFLSMKDSYTISAKRFYPLMAVTYLNQYKPKGEIFSDYSWGGYLIMNLPQRKVFVDGRMPSWRWSPEGTVDLPSAFDAYNDILAGKVDYRKVFERFGIDTVLASKGSGFSDNISYEKLEKVLSLFGWEKTDFDFLEKLGDDGWKKVYEDDISVIYQRD